MTLALVDLALALCLVEALLLRRRPELLRTLAAGAALMLALRLALADASAIWILAVLALAGVLHAVDLSSRWRARPLPASPLTVESPP